MDHGSPNSSRSSSDHWNGCHKTRLWRRDMAALELSIFIFWHPEVSIKKNARCFVMFIFGIDFRPIISYCMANSIWMNYCVAEAKRSFVVHIRKQSLEMCVQRTHQMASNSQWKHCASTGREPGPLPQVFVGSSMIFFSLSKMWMNHGGF